MSRKYITLNTDLAHYLHGIIANNSLDLVERLVAIDSVDLGNSD